jgi:formamidopyrimidine-DNA glycosylase
MPELPEVETMCRGLRPIVGCRIEKVIRPKISVKPIRFQPEAEQFCRELTGQRVERIERRGKRVIVVLESGYVVFQPKMTGLVSLTDPPDPDHIRMKWLLGACEKESERQVSTGPLEVFFWDRRGLGTLSFWTAEQLEQHLGEGKLGPDALSISVDQLCERFRKTQRAVKVALLDQKLLAGVGNLYASEILHRIEVDPRTPCHRLKVLQWEMLHRAMRDILEEAIRYEGSTLSDGTYRNALNQSGGYQNHHQVYDREGEVCRKCGKSPIKRIVQAQRATFFCPICQRRGGKRG